MYWKYVISANNIDGGLIVINHIDLSGLSFDTQEFLIDMLTPLREKLDHLTSVLNEVKAKVDVLDVKLSRKAARVRIVIFYCT